MAEKHSTQLRNIQRQKRIMKLETIIRDLQILMGIDPVIAAETESPYPGLEELVRIEIEDCAADAILNTPRMELTGWQLLPGDRLEVAEDGSATLPLPADYLMLYNIRLSGWERDVTEVMGEGHWLRKLQSSRWHGLRGVPSRPLAFETLDKDGNTALRLFAVNSSDATVESGWYLPRPQLNEAGEIDIPPAAYRQTLENLKLKMQN